MANLTFDRWLSRARWYQLKLGFLTRRSRIGYLSDLFLLLAVSDVDIEAGLALNRESSMIVYGLFTEIYDVPGFSVHFGACADSVYQALFSGLGTRLGIQGTVYVIQTLLVGFISICLLLYTS